MLRSFVCLFRGHRDRWVRNLSRYDSAPLSEVSVWACATCGREIRMGGWQAEPDPILTALINDQCVVHPTSSRSCERGTKSCVVVHRLPPMKTLPIKPGTPELPAEGANDVTVA